VTGKHIRPYEYMTPADRALLLRSMQEDKLREYGLLGWEEIGDFFVRMRFVRRRPSEQTLRKWRKQFGMPVTHTTWLAARRAPWSSNLLLHAWLATQGRALSLPRWHPFAQAVRKEPPSMKPSAIRMRAMRARRYAARELARTRGSRPLPADAASADPAPALPSKRT
jgi:hypothetical protein